jgi:opacity protein-like surface antigen
MVVTTALALLGGAAMAGAQDREGRWEFSLGALYQLGTSADFEGGSTMDTDDEFGFVMTGGYNLNDRLATNFGFQYAGIGYDATVIQDDGGQTGISGSYDTWAFSGNLILNLMEGSVTPYVGAGIGWTWVDTNIPNGLPTTGCWWDPWWGYICYTTYPTKQTNAFSYQATVGLRYEFDYSKFLRLGYTSQWMDIGTATGDNLRFDVFALEFGWMF